MCYKKPGPRCSSHAKIAWDKSKSDYLAEPTFDTYKEMRDAEEEFYLTPAGQQLIKSQISEAKSYEDKYDLTQKLENVIKLRQSKLDQIKSQDKGDVGDHDKSAPTYQTTPHGLVKDGLPYDPESEHLFKGYRPTPYLPYETDGAVCPSGGYHDDDYCRDSVLVNPRAEHITDEDYLREVFSRPSGSAVPQEWLDKVQKIGGAFQNIEVGVMGGYYGQEVGYVGPNRALRSVTDEIFYSTDNAEDDNKVLPYVRSKGVSTAGNSPVEAIKSVVKTNKFTQSTKDKFEKATEVSTSNIDLNKVDTSQVSTPTSVKYDFRGKLSKKNKPYAGVVVKDGKNYILVEGGANFQAALKGGTAKSRTWPMIVMEEPKELSWYEQQRRGSY